MKNYDHNKIESKWQKDWKKNKIYETLDSSSKPKYYILDMFPYPSGEGLHVGHPKGYIATDIISRMKRMQGMNVLHPMGFDAFGLPAENYAIQMKVNPSVAVEKNVARFKKQLEIIGLDYDWSREVNTTDPSFYKWTQWIFLKLFEKGLAYESYEPINWCSSCKTGLANEDLEDGKCERCDSEIEQKPMRQWVLKITDYAERLLEDLNQLDWPEHIKESQKNWIGKSEGAEIKFSIKDRDEKIEVFTTRPDTIFGATYVVLAPEHELVETLIGSVENEKEVLVYIDETKKKKEMDRTAEGKEKTGVELKGVVAINPANNEEIPIWIADYVLASYGTGAVMAVPAHDQRDFQFAKKYNLEIRTVVEPFIIRKEGPDSLKEGLPFSERRAVVSIIKHWSEDKYLMSFYKKNGWKGFVVGGIEKDEDLAISGEREIQEETGYKNMNFVKNLGKIHSQFYHAVKLVNRFAHFEIAYFELKDGEREEMSEEEKALHDVVWLSPEEVAKAINRDDIKIAWDYFTKGNCYTGNGILTNSGQFNGLISEESIGKITEFIKGKMVTKYKLRDWVFSRQRYWGEPIPILHDGNKIIPVAEKELPVILPKVKSYEPTGTGESPLAAINDWVNVGDGLKRETNTMPQWAGSSWYYLRYMDPNNDKALVDKEKEKYWNQVDFYVGGADHATRHLIYARFWHKFLYDIGVVSTIEPFKKLQSVGLIMGEDGRKMSKRWGNVINPDEIVKNYGADTLRVYEMFLGPFSQNASWSTQSIIGPRRFLEKIWKIGQKVINEKEVSSSEDLEKTLHKTIKKVSQDIETMSFNTAISSMMILVNEMEREVVSSKGQAISKEDFKLFLQILAPFAPHITEEIWQELGGERSIHVSDWPEYDDKKTVDDQAKIVVQVNGKVRLEMVVDKDIKEEEVKRKVLEDKVIIQWTEGKEIKKIVYIPNRIVNIVV